MTQEKFFELVYAWKDGDLTGDELYKRVFVLKDRHSWLDPDDLEFAKALQEGNRLEGVKWLCEKAKPHTLTPLKDAKEILDACR